MGYHSNEQELKKALRDIQKFINHSARLEHAYRNHLATHYGMRESDIDAEIMKVKAGNFENLNT